MTRAVLSLGSNLGDRLAHLRAAVTGFAGVLVAASPVYETAPWGGVDKIVGINPLAVAIPAGQEDDVVLDAAFSGSSHGKIRVYDQKGLPIPDGWTPVLRLHPAHPAAEPDGRPGPFDPERHAAFQRLLAEHGDPVLGVLAADVTDAVRAMRGPETVPLPADPAARAVVAVTLRRLAFTDGTSGTLAAWRGALGPTPELADPEEE